MEISNIQQLEKNLAKKEAKLLAEIEKQKQLISLLFLSDEKKKQLQAQIEKDLRNIFNDENKLLQHIITTQKNNTQISEENNTRKSDENRERMRTNLAKKLTLFDYTIGKLIAWENQRTKQESSTNKVLQGFNTTRIMKLLYFICLESVNGDKPEERNLFHTFDNFLAYKNGPVEGDVYNNRLFLYNYRFKCPFFENIRESETDPTSFELDRQSLYQGNLKIYPKDVDMINKAIEQLKQRKNFPMDDGDSLVILSHCLQLWKNAVFFTNPLMDTCFPEQIQEEKKLFDEECPIE